jgi:hypothetical protein
MACSGWSFWAPMGEDVKYDAVSDGHRRWAQNLVPGMGMHAKSGGERMILWRTGNHVRERKGKDIGVARMSAVTTPFPRLAPSDCKSHLRHGSNKPCLKLSVQGVRIHRKENRSQKDVDHLPGAANDVASPQIHVGMNLLEAWTL